ncbi:hypothetical protein PCO31110_01599 [Pandoraea communis]|uniref:Uncharacterized protein n=1 Tax=Pandoraea communis TaxID=2508297 RepID=A0A5E4TRV1_9BURK|nr:hypothetical protein [Pandoraea communis]VVD90595.1 hypothetical protein PCO31110_01599 [Pandoraea communis]
MNLHGIASGLVSSINPFVAATIKQSTGYTTNPDGTRIPAYTSIPVSVQVQALDAGRLQHLYEQNITGVLRRVYLNGNFQSVFRVGKGGGDLFDFGSGAGMPVVLANTRWLVVQVYETWPDWCSLAIQLQLDKQQ